MLTIHHSNSLDALVDALARVTGEPLESPFAPEVVVVQSRGVARWLALRLADRFWCGASWACLARSKPRPLSRRCTPTCKATP
jgi:exodeoxyribonuclease V gamma subunit